MRMRKEIMRSEGDDRSQISREKEMDRENSKQGKSGIEIIDQITPLHQNNLRYHILSMTPLYNEGKEMLFSLYGTT